MSDLIGKTYGFLTVISFVQRVNRVVFWNCKCICGKEHISRECNLRFGKVKSCGCKRGELLIKSWGTHGMSRSSEFNVWSSMKKRCYDQNNIGYERYGGRGITVCERWINSFDNFLNDMGRKPTPNHSIERKNNNGNYEPSNCHWATKWEQANNKGNNRFFELHGEKFTLPQLSRKCGIDISTLKQRMARMSVERAVSEPVAWRGQAAKPPAPELRQL